MSTETKASLTLSVLGEIEVRRGERRLDLPQSKKTRALLAYLVVSARPHKRDALCSLLWDVADDPRGALRWSLSKLRPLVNEPGVERIVSQGERVSFHAMGAEIDLLSIRRRLERGVGDLRDEELTALASVVRGEFLEGLELPHFPDFQAWCARQREEARILHKSILGTLLGRHGDRPTAAIPYAEALLRADPLDAPARAALAQVLAAAGREREAAEQIEAGRRLFQELGQDLPAELAKELALAPVVIETAAAVPSPTDQALDVEPAAASHQLVGRRGEMTQVLAALDRVASARKEVVLILTGEPGIGKTRLLRELAACACARGATVLAGAGFEIEKGRPYGPWIDALRHLPRIAFGDTLRAELAPLLPELGGEKENGSRERLFGAVCELIAARAHSAPPVVLLFDDVQWMDEASVELLHYAARMNPHRPVLIALAARAAELPDNRFVTRLLRVLRRWEVVEELPIPPLNAAETGELIRQVSPGADADPIFAESGGNPLFALEIARALPHRGDRSRTTLTELVRDRIDRLPAEASDVVRWAAVLGKTIAPRRLEKLLAIAADRLATAIETLLRHGLFVPLPGGEPAYAFGHDVVRHTVYADLSAPRRRLMHLQVAKVLSAEETTDEALITDIAHHAAFGGESAMAARACVAAGWRCLRLFAAAEAQGFARRGICYAEELPELERVQLQLELAEITIASRRPEEPLRASREIESLAGRALDLGAIEHARLGFHLLSYLRWEGGDSSGAQRYTLMAEMVSRTAEEKERVIAMAEAARCLALLDRDLPRAQALVLEAKAIMERVHFEPMAIADATGMLRLHEGRLEEAATLFAHARALARRDGDHRREFQALEHLALLELQRENFAEAAALTGDLLELGEKLPPGSEVPFARALSALDRYAQGEEAALAVLNRALAELQAVDAKQRQGAILLRAAAISLRAREPARARAQAAAALELATALGRENEVVLARIALARAAEALDDERASDAELEALAGVSAEQASFEARTALASLREAMAGRRETGRREAGRREAEAAESRRTMRTA
jgi:DNA-binding SARP family transcriptional activator